MTLDAAAVVPAMHYLQTILPTPLSSSFFSSPLVSVLLLRLRTPITDSLNRNNRNPLPEKDPNEGSESGVAGIGLGGTA